MKALNEHMYLVCDAASGMQSALIDTIKASNVETALMLLQFHVEPGLPASA